MADIEIDDGIIWGEAKEGSSTNRIWYLSFVYEGEKYKLYENVLLYDEEEVEPHVGKIMKLWEDRSSGKKRMLVRWFFRPRELPLPGMDHNSKELFLAFGKGKGVTNENDLEVIIRKCQVLCTHKDPRNKQPSEVDLRDADYFFSRVYNVDRKCLSSLDGVVNRLGCDVVFNKPGWLSRGSGKQVVDRGSHTVWDTFKHAKICEKEKAASNGSPDSLTDFPTNLKKNEKQIYSKAPGVLLSDSKKRTGELEIVIEVETRIDSENSIAQKGILSEGIKRPRLDPNDGKERKKSRTSEKANVLCLMETPFGLTSSSTQVTKPKGDIQMEHKSRAQSLVDATPLLYDTNLNPQHVSTKSSPRGHGATGPLLPQAGFEPLCLSESDQWCTRESGSTLAVKILKLESDDAKPSHTLREEDPLGISKKEESGKATETVKPPYYVNLKKDDGGGLGRGMEKDSHKDDEISRLGHTLSLREEDELESVAKEVSRKQMAILGNAESKTKQIKVISSAKSENRTQNEKYSDQQMLEAGIGKKVSFTKDTKLNLSEKTLMHKAKGATEAEKNASSTALEARTESSKPWEENLQQGLPQGKVLLVQNIDPSFTSIDVRDMLNCLFKGLSDAQVIPLSSSTKPYVQALAIFDDKSFADSAFQEMEEKCLVLTSSKRPLIASRAKLPGVSKVARFLGHFSLEKFKLSRQHQHEEMRKAVSTSHCSQPNTIEFEMAMEWRRNQELTQKCWEQLYKKQSDEIRDVFQKFKLEKSIKK